jgi:hypothetical protein
LRRSQCLILYFEIKENICRPAIYCIFARTVPEFFLLCIGFSIVVLDFFGLWMKCPGCFSKNS